MTLSKRNIEHLIDEIEDPTFQPQGEVTVEISDERTGKIKDKETRPNFVSKTWKAYARARLRLAWMGFGYNTLFTGQTLTGISDSMWPVVGAVVGTGGRALMPVMPDTHLGCWNDTTAEDSANEHTPLIPATGLVAWASRHPFSGSGARGSVDTTESAITDLLVRNVFNWTGAQGNGTFQSVGWLQLGSLGVHKAGFGASMRRRFASSALTVTSIISTATSLTSGSGYIDPSTGKLYFPVKRQSGFGIIRIVSLDLSGLNDSNANTLGIASDVTSLTLTTESIEDTPTSHVTTGEMHGFRVIGRDGSNTIFTYPTAATEASSTCRWGKIGSSGASTSYTVSAGTAVGAMSGAVISGSAYLASAADAAGANIYKHTISTGVLAATLTIDSNVTAACTAAGITTPRVLNMTTDGTDLIVMYGQTGVGTNNRVLAARVTTAGTCTQIVGLVPNYQVAGAITETATAPWAGNGVYTYPTNVLAQPSFDSLLSPGTAIATSLVDSLAVLQGTGVGVGDIWSGSTAQTTAPGTNFFTWYDGALHFMTTPAATALTTGGTAVFSGYRQGYDLGSRVLLGSSKVKTASDFMKITYDIVIPGWF